jgi:hypothetical protein
VAWWQNAIFAALSLTAVACGGAKNSICASVRHSSANEDPSPARLCREPQSSSNLVRLEVEGGTVLVDFDPADYKANPEIIWKWITDAARGVTLFFGRFPVSECTLRIKPRAGRGAMWGQASGYPKPNVLIILGQESTAQDFAEDWTLTHELAHLAFPNVAQKHRWIEEGLATYVEPIVRFKMGLRTERSVWSEWYQSMPQGQPEAGDRGLDYTPSWGRVYWGGALFSLVADVEIRRQSQNRFGLRDALQGIVKSGGTMAVQWKIEDAFAAGDRATQTPVLLTEYRKRRADPAPVNLDELWTNLGVSFENGRVKLDDNAPWAFIRHGILRN